MGRRAVVIVESNSRWPSFLGEDPQAMGDLCVVAQRPGESLTALKRRASRRLKALEASDVPKCGVLVCGMDPSPRAFAFRHAILEKLLDLIERGERGEVVLSAVGDHAQLRRLGVLAREMTEQLDEGSMTSLRFRAQPLGEDGLEDESAIAQRVA